MKLPLEMVMVHLVFHVSMLKKFIGDSSFIVPMENVDVEKKLTYKEVKILNKLRGCGTRKLLWLRSYGVINKSRVLHEK